MSYLYLQRFHLMFGFDYLTLGTYFLCTIAASKQCLSPVHWRCPAWRKSAGCSHVCWLTGVPACDCDVLQMPENSPGAVLEQSWSSPGAVLEQSSRLTLLIPFWLLDIFWDGFPGARVYVVQKKLDKSMSPGRFCLRFCIHDELWHFYISTGGENFVELIVFTATD